MIFVLPVPMFGLTFTAVFAFLVFVVFAMFVLWIYKLIASIVVGG